jgi:hypothetical protein
MAAPQLNNGGKMNSDTIRRILIRRRDAAPLMSDERNEMAVILAHIDRQDRELSDLRDDITDINLKEKT